jgi:hypothetical protein
MEPPRRSLTIGFGGFRLRCSGRRTQLVAAIAATAAVAVVLPAASGATVLAPWGSNLAATPTLDTANGATQFTNDEPASSFYGQPVDEAIPTNFTPTPGCTRSFVYHNLGVAVPCSNWTHTGADIAVWNTHVAGGSATAPAGGQVLAVKVKGCTIEDPSAPVQYSQVPGEAKVPIGSIEFQDLTPNGDGSYTSHSTAPGPSGVGFQVPFCSNPQDPSTGSVSTSTVTTDVPAHFCVNQGDVVGIFQSGGFIPGGANTPYLNDGNWYTQGAPVMIMASINGSGMDSFTDADVPNRANPPTYSPNAPQPRGDNSGWGQESNQEVQLQVIEAVGDDAYGLCPGGDAVEPASSNSVQCVTRSTGPNDPYGSCNAQNQPVRPPRNLSAPTIAVSSNGAAVAGAPLPGNRMDATPGTWTQDPNQSFIRYAYHWEDCDSNGANCAPIGGQAGINPYYYVTNGDVGHTIEVAVTATNTANTEGPASSAPTQVVAGPSVPVISNLKLNPSTWNEASSTVITYDDTEAANTTITVLKNGVVVKTLSHTDTAKQYGGNGIKLAGLPAGSYQLQVTPSNRGTLGQPQTLSFTVTSATPVITSLRVNPSSFNASRGATVTYVDSVAGNAVLSVVKCKKRKKGVCTKYKTFKTVRHTDRAGANGVKLAGVAVGHYQLKIVSYYAGRTGLPVLTPFTARLMKSKRHHRRHELRHSTLQISANVAILFVEAADWLGGLSSPDNAAGLRLPAARSPR